MAKNLEQFKADIQANEALSAKFKGLKTMDDVVAAAKAEGYEFTAEEIEKLADVSAEDLAKVAGGEGPEDRWFIWSGWCLSD